MEGLMEKISKVANPEAIIKSMVDASDPWFQATVYVSNAIKKEKLSKSKGKTMLIFAAHWIAEQYKHLCVQKQALETKVCELNTALENLTVTATTASALGLDNQKTLQENELLHSKNNELVDRLLDAESAIRLLASCKKDNEYSQGLAVCKETEVQKVDCNVFKKSRDDCFKMAPVSTELKRGAHGQVISETTVNRSLSISEIQVLSKTLGSVGFHDDPVEIMIRIEKFSKFNANLTETDTFAVIMACLDQSLKSSLPSDVFAEPRSKEHLVKEILNALCLDELDHHSVFGNGTQRMGECVQSYTDRLFIFYKLTLPSDAEANQNDHIYKKALLKRCLPEIISIVGLTVSANNHFLKIVN